MTIDVTNSPSLSRRGTLSRQSSYSSYSARSATSATSTGSKDPLDRVRDYSCISTDAIFPSPTLLAPPAYSPPPNTPATFEPIHQIHDYSQITLSPFTTETKDGGEGAPQDADPFNPYSYTGPTQYPNHSLAPPHPSNRIQGLTYLQPNPILGSDLDADAQYSSGSSIIDLEKARSLRKQNSAPKRKRSCGKMVICCVVFGIVVVLGIIAAIVAVVKMKQYWNAHHSHSKRATCIDVEVPGMWLEGSWEEGYKKCI